LNPAWAGLIAMGKAQLKGYRWSSYPWYLKPARSNPSWLERGRVMGTLRLKPEDRRSYEAYLEGRVLELGLKAGRAELEGQWKALRRGWYVGGESFRAKLRQRVGRLVRGLRPESHSGAVKREHGEQAAEQLLREGLAALGLTAEELAQGPKVTAEKAALARWVRELTTVSLRWVSARLTMGHYSNAGRGPRKMRARDVRKARKARSKLDTIAAKT
jgi:hypothetical protein